MHFKMCNKLETYDSILKNRVNIEISTNNNFKKKFQYSTVSQLVIIHQ